MATVEELSRSILASVDQDVGFLNCVKWIDDRYRQLVGRVKFKHLRKVGELLIPAAVTGTVTVTSGSTAVVGSGTTWETAPTTSLNAYWYMKVKGEWYNIASVTDDTNLVFTTVFSQDTSTDTAFTLVKRYHEVAADARWLGTFIHTRLHSKLDGPIPMDKLDRAAPGRLLVMDVPSMVAHAGVDSTGDLLVEVYPYCKGVEILHYTYWDLPSTLATTSTIPTQVDPHVLKEGALIDMYRYLKGKALNAGNVEAATVWRNDEHAQRTVWERMIQTAVRADRGVDDTTMILEYFGGKIGGGDIRTARDEVYVRGVRGTL